MDWASAGWIIAIGALVGGAAGLVGCFLILRRMAMLGDAISHAVLPSIVVAYLMGGHDNPVIMVLIAGVFGLLTTFVVQSLQRAGVQEDAGIGVTFTALFAVGVVLISMYAGDVHLDLDHVLYGEIAYAPWDVLLIGGKSYGPVSAWMMGAIFLLDLLVIGLFYKEFKLCAFDPQMAAAVGINVAVMHYLLMGLVSVTTVGAFNSVGAILVVAMLIVPGATAYLLTERLGVMLVLSVVQGAVSSALGYWVAMQLDSSIAGAISTMSGALFALAFLFAPRQGLISRWAAQRRLRHQQQPTQESVEGLVADTQAD